MIVASVVTVLLWLRWGGIRKGIWIDLDVYIRGASAVMHHEPLYGVSVQGQPFTYPPFAALLFVPLELLGNVGARGVLTAASIGCYFLVVVVCARRLRMSLASAGLVALTGLAFEPFARNILLGQINLVLVALVVVDCFTVPARYRGILIGIAAGVKLVPGAFILFLVLKREWGAALRCVAAFMVTAGLGAVFAPRDSGQFWSGGFINLSRFGKDAVIRGDNQSLTGAIMRLSRDLSPSPILIFVLSVAALALGLIAAKRQIDSGNDVARAGMHRLRLAAGLSGLVDSPLDLGRGRAVGSRSRTPPPRRRPARHDIRDRTNVVHAAWGPARAQPQLVAGCRVRVVRVCRIGVLGLARGGSPTFT